MKGTSRILTLSTESCRLMRGAEKTDFEYILESQAEHQMFLLSDQGYAGSYRYIASLCSKRIKAATAMCR